MLRTVILRTTVFFLAGAMFVGPASTEDVRPQTPDIAAFDGCRLVSGPTLVVAAVEDGETLVLDDGAKVRLIGAMSPRKPLITHNKTGKSLNDGKLGLAADTVGAGVLGIRRPRTPSEDARMYLASLTLGQPATLWRPRVHAKVRRKRHKQQDQDRQGPFAAFPRDRYGRILAHVTVPVGGRQFEQNDRQKAALAHQWVQAQMIRAGMARAYSATDARACITQLLVHENAARQSDRQIWRQPSFHVRRADRPAMLLPHMHTFQIVEGRVRKVARYRNTTYINFGRHWRSDFTLLIEGRAHRLFRKHAFNIKSLEGQTVRVRGWIERADGPMMRLTHPEQIERLDTNGVPSHLLASGALDAFDQLRDRRVVQTKEHRGRRAAQDPGDSPRVRKPKRTRKPLRAPANAVRTTSEPAVETLSM